MLHYDCCAFGRRRFPMVGRTFHEYWLRNKPDVQCCVYAYSVINTHEVRPTIGNHLNLCLLCLLPINAYINDKRWYIYSYYVVTLLLLCQSSVDRIPGYERLRILLCLWEWLINLQTLHYLMLPRLEKDTKWTTTIFTTQFLLTLILFFPPKGKLFVCTVEVEMLRYINFR